ncbi:unnamed protein product [Effrenium voratum]|nr:unnamed protein product [Effrenium voratum]
MPARSQEKEGDKGFDKDEKDAKEAKEAKEASLEQQLAQQSIEIEASGESSTSHAPEAPGAARYLHSTRLLSQATRRECESQGVQADMAPDMPVLSATMDGACKDADTEDVSERIALLRARHDEEGSELDEAMIQLVDSAGRAASCAKMHSQRILQAREKALSAMEASGSEILEAQGELAKLQLQLDGVMWDSQEDRGAAETVLRHARPRGDARWRLAFSKLRALRPQEPDCESQSRGVQTAFDEESAAGSKTASAEAARASQSQTSNEGPAQQESAAGAAGSETASAEAARAAPIGAEELGRVPTRDASQSQTSNEAARQESAVEAARPGSGATHSASQSLALSAGLAQQESAAGAAGGQTEARAVPSGEAELGSGVASDLSQSQATVARPAQQDGALLMGRSQMEQLELPGMLVQWAQKRPVQWQQARCFPQRSQAAG